MPRERITAEAPRSIGARNGAKRASLQVSAAGLAAPPSSHDVIVPQRLSLSSLPYPLSVAVPTRAPITLAQGRDLPSPPTAPPRQRSRKLAFAIPIPVCDNK